MPLGLGDLSCQYAKDIKTPNLESLKLFVRNLITKTGHFPAFLYQTAIHVLLPMIKYSFFKKVIDSFRRLFQLLSFNSSFVLSAKNRGILIKLPSCFKFSIE